MLGMFLSDVCSVVQQLFVCLSVSAQSVPINLYQEVTSHQILQASTAHKSATNSF